jgi:hypothetical protein
MTKIELAACPHCGGSDVYFFSRRKLISRQWEVLPSGKVINRQYEWAREVSHYVRCRTCLTTSASYSRRDEAATCWRDGRNYWVRITSQASGRRLPRGWPRWENRVRRGRPNGESVLLGGINGTEIIETGLLRARSAES